MDHMLGARIRAVTVAFLSGCLALTTAVFAPPAQGSAGGAGDTPPRTEEVDWMNRTYDITCDDEVDEPVPVTMSNGTGSVTGDAIGPERHWEVRIQRIVHGTLPRLGTVTAVLFRCEPQPSNYFTEELRVYRTRGGAEIGRTPTFDVPSFSPEFRPETLEIQDDRLSADLAFYGDRDPHGRPSILRRVTWTWDGRQFVKRSETDLARTDLGREEVTVDGIGPVRIGMSAQEVEKVTGAPLTLVGDASHCTDGTLAGTPDGLSMMFMQNSLVAVTVESPATVSTASGMGVGTTRDELFDTYGTEISTERTHDGSERLVFAPTAPRFEGRVIVFDLTDGQVERFSAGTRDATTVGSCS
ncbi:hypothetical protein [Streptomyces pseudogriseolus]|uniref:hypothetical protein n=1 Tax=Streptomyces pseudogriseolus TaxID=36817 RepID=UPI001CE2D040|nr:hypothetical protein [Streptomyces pseudogriseolus]